MVTSPQGAHDVLASSSNETMDKLTVIYRETRLIGDNVFTLPYERWRPQRRTLQPLFTRQHVATFGSRMGAAADERALSWSDGARVDLHHEMHGLTRRVLDRSLFGVDFDDQDANLSPNIYRMMNHVTGRGFRPVRAPQSLPTPARHRFRRARAAIDAMIEDAITDARNNPEHGGELVQLLLSAEDPQTGRRLTRDEVVSNLLVFLVAGHDTTATTLTYALWALGRHPELQQRVADEAGALDDRALTVEDVAALPYTVQVIHEALRICPPAVALARMATRDTVVDGFRIERGTNLLVGIWAIHHDPALWNDPEIFDPDRFGPDRPRPDRWRFLPFGAGARSCIGDHFAMLEATLGIASVIRRRRVTALDPTFPTTLPFTMIPDGPIPVLVETR